MTEPVGLVGLGAMGSRFGRRLVAAGCDLVVHDPVPEAVAACTALGARAASSPREVADLADVVLVSLPSPAAVREVAYGDNGLVHGGAIRTYVDLSTTGAAAAEEVAAALAAAGVEAVDAPVSGGPAGAEAGTLTVMVSGAADAVDRVRPMLDALGSRIFVVGERPGQAQVVKLVNNLLSAAAIAVTAEGLALAAKAGLDPGTVLDVIGVSSGASNAASDKFPKQVLTRRFDHGFRLDLMAKDVRLCLDEADRRQVPMLLGGAVDQLWRLAQAELEDGVDCTAVVQLVERWAGTTIGSDTDKRW